MFVIENGLNEGEGDRMSFEKQLKRELFLYGAILIFLATIALTLGLYYYRSSSSDNILKRQEADIVTTFKTVSDNIVKENNQGYASYRDYLDGKIDANAIYYQFSLFQSQEPIKRHLIIVDKEKQIILTTSNKFKEDSRFGYYLSLVLDSSVSKGTLNYKVFSDANRDRYLLVIKEIGNFGSVIQVFERKDIENYLNRTDANYLIYDQFDNVLSASSDQFVEPRLLKVKTDIIELSFNYNRKSFVSRSQDLNQQLSLVTYTEKEPFYQILSRTLVYIFPFVVGMVCLVFYLGKKISMNTARSVEWLKDEMNQVMYNPLHRLEPKGEEEFVLIAREINRMLEQLNDSHQRNLYLIQENIVFERKKLEAQFNPHFLYNTLEVIRSSCFYDVQLANKLILLLNDILRYSIDNTQTVTSMSQDIMYIEKYLEIATIRFDDLTYEIEMSNDLLKERVPKLFLLPLIENSLKYGFKYQSELHIAIEGRELEPGIYSVIYSDNGNVLSDRDIEELLVNIYQPGIYGNHHGLINCKRRVELMYPNSSFTIYKNKEELVIEIVFAVKEVSEVV